MKGKRPQHQDHYRHSAGPTRPCRENIAHPEEQMEVTHTPTQITSQFRSLALLKKPISSGGTNSASSTSARQKPRVNKGDNDREQASSSQAPTRPTLYQSQLSSIALALKKLGINPLLPHLDSNFYSTRVQAARVQIHRKQDKILVLSIEGGKISQGRHHWRRDVSSSRPSVKRTSSHIFNLKASLSAESIG